MKFDDLRFKPFSCVNGVRACVTFKNGYSVIIITGKYTIGGNQGLYELSIFDKDENRSTHNPILREIKNDKDYVEEIDYSGNVLYSLTREEVVDYLNRIESLPK